MGAHLHTRFAAGLLALLLPLVRAGASEVVLQYFNASWEEITRRIPEVAEAGYDALWLPPPTKAGGQLSVGYDPYDRFDLGDRDQNGLATRYGTATELIHLVEVAHRFGLRVYFDSVMAHNGAPSPNGSAPGTLGPTGFVPEDYHLIRLTGTTYKNPPGPDDKNEWEVLNRTWFGLDIAQENPNDSFGYGEGDNHGKWSGIRHPAHPEFYPDRDLPQTRTYGGDVITNFHFANRETYDDIGYTNTAVQHVAAAAGNGRFDWEDVNANGQHNAGEPSETFVDGGIDPSRADRRTAAWGYGDGIYNMGDPIAEDVNSLLFRAACRLVDLTACDGFRLDAVKHVPAYYFGKLDAPKDDYNWGYCGRIQEQFNLTHGYSDWNNHRNGVFSDTLPRDDAMLFGEHLGGPPYADGSVNAGMRVADDGFLNAVKGNIGSNLEGMDTPFYGVTTPGQRVLYVMSHDNNYIWGGDREQAHAVMLTREGLPIVYTDGYNQSGPPSWFPKPAEIPFLGQFGSKYVPNLLDINRHFGWGHQSSRWNAWDFTSYARYDPDVGANGEGVTMVFMLAKGYLNYWPHKDVNALFPEGARLVNYAYHGGPFWVKVSGGKFRHLNDGLVYVPSGQYFAFSWRTPQMPLVWGEGFQQEQQPITILQNGQPVPTMTALRTDGVNGDPAFNPYAVPDANASDRAYAITLPRITSATNLTILARADGSAENILLKLDGGIDLNSQMAHVTQAPGTRDNPPTVSKDKFLGYEQMRYVRRVAEKFAAQHVSRNVIGSLGAETYAVTIGTGGATVANGSGWNTGAGTATWVYHEPTNVYAGATNQFNPPPASAAGQPVDLWIKVGYQYLADAVVAYYTTNGANPEGSAGIGKGDTRVAAGGWIRNAPDDGTGVPDWWKCTLPAMPAGTPLRYKLGAFRQSAPSRFPWSEADIEVRHRMETQFEITNFHGGAVTYFPHNDWGRMKTGLDEGYHVLRSRAFLGRNPGDTAIYRQFNQTFYYDTQRPTGAILSPAVDGLALTSSPARVVTRSDMTVDQAWCRIDDSDPSNDDAATGTANGNGAWVRATKGSVPSPLPRGQNEKEWTFRYVNVPTSGVATILVRLLEATSSTNMALDDATGHFTTLARTALTGGSSARLFVHTPSADGDSVAVGSLLDVRFTKALTAGYTNAPLHALFTVMVNGVPLATNGMNIVSDVTPAEHALQLPLPNLYNGQPAFVHTIDVTYQRDGFPALSAERAVLAVIDDDSNDDGIPDYWERQWQVGVGSLDPAGNPDGDAFNNLQEYIANTDPFDPNDGPRIDAALETNQLFQVEFMAQSNRNYLVWFAENLHADPVDWMLALPPNSPIAGEGHPMAFATSPADATNRFYRIEVRIP